jgi:hypothetical protein
MFADGAAETTGRTARSTLQKSRSSLSDSGSNQARAESPRSQAKQSDREAWRMRPPTNACAQSHCRPDGQSITDPSRRTLLCSMLSVLSVVGTAFHDDLVCPKQGDPRMFEGPVQILPKRLS